MAPNQNLVSGSRTFLGPNNTNMMGVGEVTNYLRVPERKGAVMSMAGGAVGGVQVLGCRGVGGSEAGDLL